MNDKVHDASSNSYRYLNSDGTLGDTHYCLNGECNSLSEVGQPMIDNRNGTHTCPTCHQTVTTDEDKLNAFGEAAARENEQRSREISNWLGW